MAVNRNVVLELSPEALSWLSWVVGRARHLDPLVLSSEQYRALAAEVDAAVQVAERAVDDAQYEREREAARVDDGRPVVKLT